MPALSRSSTNRVASLAVLIPAAGRSETHDGGQSADVRDFGVVIRLATGTVAAIDEHLFLHAKVVGGHQVVAQAGRHMQDVLGSAAELIKHVLERTQPRLVRLRLLGGV